MNTRRLLTLLMVAFALSISTMTQAQTDQGYQMPPDPIAQLADADRTPGVMMSPDHKWLVYQEVPSYPSIEEVAQPELRIGGLRINPRNNGSSRAGFLKGLRMKSLEDGKDYPIKGLPASPRIERLSWSPDGNKMAFIHNNGTQLELWLLNLNTQTARKLTDYQLNDAIRGTTFLWLSDSKSIVARMVPEGRGAAPEKPVVPLGPVIQESKGQEAAVRTYQDLLKNPFDESLFAYYTESQLMHIQLDGNVSKIGEPGIVYGMSSSPDDNFLLIQRIQAPFSYLVPYYRFPMEVEIWSMRGTRLQTLASIPAAENIPKGFGAVRTGRRSFTWRADVDAEVYWVEALDEGDPANKVEFRDQVFSLKAPFSGEPVAEMKLALRYSGMSWGNEGFAIVTQRWWKDRHEIKSSFSPSLHDGELKTIFDRSWEDRYNSPGNFVTKRNARGRSVLMMDNKGESLFLIGVGASEEGNRPFVDQYDLASGETERWWRSQAPYYEYPLEILDVKKRSIFTRRESVEEAPNYYIRDLKKDNLTALTDFQHPYPQLKEVHKELVQYKRKDGVELSGTLYLPPGYDEEKDGPIPVLMWAYPEEFKSAAAAGQVSGSPHRFIRLSWASPLYWLMQGYAILDDPGMPIIGEDDAEPNDTFVEQLVSNAEAAIDYLVDRGIADRSKIAIGGHSYGAFMTANLLAHSDLFACGIARSGAYNRTLTPFGFQREERTFWESPDIYFTMSPFMHADKINQPILLIHGEADNNSGTYPMQSERFYSALKGHGADVRLVMLPHESHGYRARESIMHMLWEMSTFMAQHMEDTETAKGR